MCLFGSFFQSKKYAFMYWKGESVFYRFLFSSKKGGRKERNTKSVFELIFSWFWKGLFSHIDCSLCFENSYVTPSVPHSHSVNAGWGLKSTPPLAILYWASQVLLGCPVDLSKSCRFTVSYPGQFSGVPVCGILATRTIAQIFKLLNSHMFLLFEEIMYNGEKGIFSLCKMQFLSSFTFSFPSDISQILMFHFFCFCFVWVCV